MRQTVPMTKKTMKNNTALYLAKGDKSTSALLKRRALDDYFGTAELEYLESGKPMIKSPEGYGISVSHSGGIVAAVISKGNVGLDIEERKERDRTRLLSFFHESERDSDFYDMWTKKESYGKLTGEGVYMQKGKRLPDGMVFIDISDKVSELAGKDFEGKICMESKNEGSIEVIYLGNAEK